MTNERLRAAMLAKGDSVLSLAEELKVDPKTVQRWLGGRAPIRATRYKVAELLDADEAYLWPEALSAEVITNASENEIVHIYPHRWTVPREVWRTLFHGAQKNIDILVHAGMFLVEDTGLLRLLEHKADQGVHIRLLLGDPDSPELRVRELEEGIVGLLPSRVRNAIALYESLLARENAELRLHSTTLYNSIYRADDELMVNTHVFGFAASKAPVMWLRRVAGGEMVSTYQKSIDNVWALSRPPTAED